MNLISNPFTIFKTPRKQGTVSNTCAPRKRTKPTKPEARLAARIDSFQKQDLASKGGYTKPGSMNK